MATDPYNPLVQDLVPLNEVKYAARDYPSIYDSLLRRLKIEYQSVYNDYATTTQAIMFVELMAYATAQLQWYLDRTASDCFLETSRTRAAVARLVKQIGYKMGAAAASSTILTLTFPDGTTGPFTMPARWRYQGPGGLIYESYASHSQPVPLAAGESISVAVRQGETRLLTYTANGSKNQQYQMTNIGTDRFLGGGTVDAWVDGLLWTEYEFMEFEKTNHYEVGYNDAPPIAQFGDGIAGNIPPPGAEIKLRFVIIDGEKGNVKANTITSSIDTLTIGGNAVTFTVTNQAGANGGTDPEDPERAKRLAPFAFAARGAAITEQDYEALSNSYTDPTYGSVAKAYAFNPRTSYEDIVFNGYTEQIEDYLDKYLNGGTIVDPPVTFTGMIALETQLAAYAASLSPLITGLNEDVTNLASVRTDLESQIGTAVVQNTTAKSSASSAETDAALSVSNCGDADTELDNLIVYVESLGLPSAEEEEVVDRISSAIRSIGFASSYSQQAQTASGTAVGALTTAINDFLNPAFVSVTELATLPDFSIPSIIVDMNADLTGITSIVEGAGGMQDQINTMVGQGQTLEDLILPELVLMQERIGELFDADCMSNYVQVPILSLDVDGNYAAPSVGLMTGLQSYLTQIKEVTQHVEVIDGSSILVQAEIEVLLEVNKDAFIEAEVVSDVVATIVGMLKGRDFNEPLYLSELYENVKATSDGIIRANVEITGPLMVPSVIDSEGNLVPEPNRVIIYGSLLVTDKDGNTLYQG